jgi:hypothetical protein
VGFLDRAKKLAEQAKDMAGDALADVKTKTASTGGGTAPPAGATAAPPARPVGDPQFGTPYVPGMLGRPGWREQGLTDPAAVLPIDDRDRAGVPRSTKSQVVEEPYGMGRRWTSGGRSVGLFYQLYPEHQAWQPGTSPLPDGRSVVLLGGQPGAALEVSGIDDATGDALAAAARQQLDNNE